MRTGIFFLLALCLLAGTLQARSLTDDYGRTVDLPETVTRIYAASPPLTMSVLAFDPALIAALNFPWSDAQRPYAGAADGRPVAGGFFGQGQTPNFEVLALTRPDVILVWGGMPGVEKIVGKFDALGIPVLLVRNSSIRDLLTQFALLGRLTGNTQRADALVAYTEQTLALIDALQPKLAERKPVRYYFAEGPDGLSSECDGSFHLEPFTYAGAKNALECRMSSNYGMEKVSLETVMLADPDVIVAMEPVFADAVGKDPRWQALRAVREGRVLTVPSLPFNYITRPPSFMRLMGIRWLINHFYPEWLEGEEEARFEALFFPAYDTAAPAR
ncbi:ABC transporter substrate-binding protein [Sulfurimonas sp. HSL-1656]|uniref:ABC transporter substrate-binding protein n=1 Tax=Thiomicrolovo subterrani TaxID=3131934 RepID=UPI0031F73A8E